MKGFTLTKLGRMAMLSAVAAVLSVSWLGCVVDNGTGPSGGTAPRITTATLPSGAVGTSYSQTLKATGDTPITWSLESGALPTGLNLLRSGTISGTPTTAGTYNFSVDASNSAGSDVSSFSITITGESTIPITPTSYSLDGVWKSNSSGNILSIYDNKAVWAEISDAAWKEAEKRGNVGIGALAYRNITKTGASTWSGESSTVNTGTYVVGWNSSVTITLSADGQTFTTVYSSGTGGGTWTKISHNEIDGVWKSNSSGNVLSIYDNKAVWVEISDAAWKEAEKRGNVGIGALAYRNITKTGASTWSGESSTVNTGTYVVNWNSSVTITLSADGQTFTTVYSSGTGGGTWTRQQ